MSRFRVGALTAALLVWASNSPGQDPKPDEPKKADPPVKLKGFLPMNWGKLGLTDEQKQSVYRIQARYAAEIEKLEAQIRELKAARDKELKGVLTPEQKKRLEDILLGRDK